MARHLANLLNRSNIAILRFRCAVISIAVSKQAMLRRPLLAEELRFANLWRRCKRAQACRWTVLLIALVISIEGVAPGQVSPGMPNFSAFDGHEVDTVNLMNNNIVLSVPIRSKRGALPFQAGLIANSYAYASGGYWFFSTQQQYGTNPAFSASINGIVGLSTVAFFTTSINSTCNGYPTELYQHWYVQTADGATHPLSIGDYTTSTSGPGCHPTFTDTTTDGSGITVVASGGSGSVYLKSGDSVPAGSYNLTDPNGNTLKLQGQSFVDSMGLPSVTASSWEMGLPSAPSYSWTDVNGGSPTLTQNTTNYNIKTAYGCSGIVDQTSGSTYLTTGFSFPDGTSLGLTYEPTPADSTKRTGRIKQITLREGGTVTYTYGGTHNGIDCTYQTVPILTRTLGNGDVTTYTLTHSLAGGTSYNAVNTVIDPGGNQTIYTFTGFTSTGNSPNLAQVLTDVKKYQGSSTVLSEDVYCYNTAFASCSFTGAVTALVSYPITTTIVMHKLGGMSAASATETHFDAYGNVTYSAQYDFGGTSPVRATTITYYQTGTICGALSTGSHINDKPCEVSTTQNASTMADAKYTYDQYGNLLTTSLWNGSSWIGQTTANVYNANGTISKSYDLANNETDYAYDQTKYTNCGSCTQFPFPTKITNHATGMNSLHTWDGIGGVQTSTTDYNNGNVTTLFYSNSANVADPFWQLRRTQDITGTVWYSDPLITSSGTFNGAAYTLYLNGGNSISQKWNWLDSWGRPSVSQVTQTPGGTNYDTTSMFYGWGNGYHGYNTSQPCSAAQNTACASGQVHTVWYDPLGRFYGEVTNGNETLSESYTNQDLLEELSPAPTGEHVKETQTEYDGLGRVSKVCHILTVGGTACGQATGLLSGIVDIYTYGQGTGYTSVSIARGSETRTFTYDALGRMIQKNTPEGGLWYYRYDSQPGCTSNPGKPICYTDPNGNTITYTYDTLNRVIFAGAGATTCRHFYYDNSKGYSGTIPTGISISNPYGRLVEAATDSCTANSLITDEWFSYDQKGRVTTQWQLTPHSTQYYKTVVSYFENNAVNTVQLASPSLYTMTYGVDGEGRSKTLTDTTTGQDIITGVTYNNASQPLQILLTGSTPDQDDYTYDANTGLMKTFEFEVGNTPANMSGTLTWNSNRTLQSLAIVDGFKSGGSQTCGDVYDDVARLGTYDCGSGNWGQTFTYDNYDNLDKSVISGRSGSTWSSSYDAHNHFTSFGSTYDADGNVTYDGNNTYQWNEFSKLKATATSGTPNCGTSGTCFTYDAFGNIVEVSSGSSWKEIWLTPAGTVAMTGTTPSYAQWQAPGGGTAVVGGNSSYFDYLHKDWVGSARVVSSITSASVVADRAFTPYGEMYDAYGSSGSQYNMFAGTTNSYYTSGVVWDTPNRELSENVGRWLSPDPADSGWNQYAYATNPNSGIDPSGLKVLPTTNPGWYLGFAGGGGFGGCTIDDVDTPCQLAFATTGSGAGAQCPQNNCQGVRLNALGEFYRTSYDGNPDIFQYDDGDFFPTHWVTRYLGNAGEGLPSSVLCVYIGGGCDVPLTTSQQATLGMAGGLMKGSKPWLEGAFAVEVMLLAPVAGGGEAIAPSIGEVEPLPPGWNENWEQMYNAKGNLSWWDEEGGSWRWHDVDSWHDTPHWDYNPNSNPYSPSNNWYYPDDF